MYCRRCGSHVREGDDFCTACGSPLEAGEQASGDVGPQRSLAEAGDRRSVVPIALAAVFAAAAIMGAAGLLLSPVKAIFPSNIVEAEDAVAIDEAAFPDAAFREFAAGCDADSDGVLQQGELDAVTVIDLYGMGIADLTGVEHFTALEELDCSGNGLSSLDVSRNTALRVLYCSGNGLTSLDVSRNTALVGLYCKDNGLTSLDVSGNPALTRLHCGGNNLSSLDVGQNTALEIIQ